MQSTKSLFKQPSAWFPITMSLAALVITLGYLVIYGLPEVPAVDEGTPAHIFQLLIAGQVPIIAFFAIKYLPQSPKQAFQILAVQFVAALVACAPVFILEL